MPNDLSRRPWSLDTAAVITTDRVRIKALRAVAVANAADVVRVEDNNGERIWDAVATGLNTGLLTQDFGGKGQDFDGFELAEITTGILYVYLG